MNRLGMWLRIDMSAVASSQAGSEIALALLQYCSQDDEMFLDLIDAALQMFQDFEAAYVLMTMLEEAASAWTVSLASNTLMRRVSDEASSVYAEAMQGAQTDVAEEMQQAWSNAFGRNGDPSDAWDHAIKALEAALGTVVSPKNSGATMGTILRDLESGSRWRSSYPGNKDDHAIGHLVSTLRMIWPNPDRHKSGSSRAPEEAEARSVVALVAALLQANNESPLVYKV